MKIKDKLNLMKQIDEDNRKHVEDWKEENMKIWVADYAGIDADGNKFEATDDDFNACRIQVEALTIEEALIEAKKQVGNLAVLGNWQDWKIYCIGMCNKNVW